MSDLPTSFFTSRQAVCLPLASNQESRHLICKRNRMYRTRNPPFRQSLNCDKIVTTAWPKLRNVLPLLLRFLVRIKGSTGHRLPMLRKTFSIRLLVVVCSGPVCTLWSQNRRDARPSTQTLWSLPRNRHGTRRNDIRSIQPARVQDPRPFLQEQSGRD